MMEISPRPVHASDLATLASPLRYSTTTPQAGLFGPGSVSWRVNRESALFFGAGRASLLQLAHPWVAVALDQHSNLRNDPLARFHNTFRVVFAMVFGSLDQAISASRYLHRRHSSIRGEMPSPVAAWPRHSHYEANELNALIWVYATLVESALVAYDAVLPPLTAAQRETYFSESKRLAALFGIPSESLPQNWSGFEAYMEDMYRSSQLGVDNLARDLADGVLHGRGTWLPVPEWYRALTTCWLPPHLREAFALPYGPSEQASTQRAIIWLRRIYPRLPAPLRFVGPYREACARLSERRAGPLVRASNRFWTGHQRTMFHPDRL